MRREGRPLFLKPLADGSARFCKDAFDGFEGDVRVGIEIQKSAGIARVTGSLLNGVSNLLESRTAMLIGTQHFLGRDEKGTEQAVAVLIILTAIWIGALFPVLRAGQQGIGTIKNPQVLLRR